MSIAPINQVLTTQEAADFLEVSRPTLVKLLEDGEIPFEKVRRHRRVRLNDVVNYRDTRRQKVREGLKNLSQSEFAEGITQKTVGLLPAMR